MLAPKKASLLDRMVLGSYVLPQECGRTLLNMVALGPEAVRETINRWSPFY